jgi:hypothetical protein
MIDTLLQIPGPGTGCYSGGFGIGCILNPFTAALGSWFVLMVAIAIGGGLAVYQRTPVPLAITAVLVGALAVDVLPPAIASNIVLLAIAVAASALFFLYRRLR